MHVCVQRSLHVSTRSPFKPPYLNFESRVQGPKESLAWQPSPFEPRKLYLPNYNLFKCKNFVVTGEFIALPFLFEKLQKIPSTAFHKLELKRVNRNRQPK